MGASYRHCKLLEVENSGSKVNSVEGRGPVNSNGKDGELVAVPVKKELHSCQPASSACAPFLYPSRDSAGSGQSCSKYPQLSTPMNNSKRFK